MLALFKRKLTDFWNEEDGLGTLEMILIIGVILIVALIFKDQIQALVENLLESVTSKSNEFF
ncbi:Flp1 family type IVb pilin [Paenibacillus shunpengii]|uniref:Flp1 family type IVb pilin n=1 Tax=Paenibacillus shunpengii TaxID=2054424 RepID=A0ABW5SIM5_9BACL|nr:MULTISPECIES: Flp1 family type IVb pilin [unclassified Paenibacillus]OMC71847.1 hypothetical protein BK126_07325 [Paenibacillus sp. FSL H7-0326]SDW39942.1 Putative Flagellin, Flp1-like, domain [Paenibacillus sp. PDC88]